MKVFTSIFVFEGMHTTFEGVEDALRSEVAHPQKDELAEWSRRNVMELRIHNEVRDQTGGRA